MLTHSEATTLLVDVQGFLARADAEGNIYVDFPQAYGVAELDEFLGPFGAYIASREPGAMAMVVDVSQVEGSSSPTRRRIAQFFESHAKHIEPDCRGFAVVVKSALQKGAISAIFWIRPVPWPTKVFNDRAAAEAWALEQRHR